jgi:hypothetical protein
MFLTFLRMTKMWSKKLIKKAHAKIMQQNKLKMSWLKYFCHWNQKI